MGLVWVVLVACHVDLRLPPQPASPEQRVAAFNQLAATHMRITYNNKGGASRTLVLGDGREVRYPADLIPVVAPDSKTARRARTATSAASKSRWYALGGMAVALVGVALTADPDINGAVGPAVIVTGLVGLGFGLYYRFVYWHAEEDAYETYDDDLAATLNVCVNELTVTPCELLQSPTGHAGPPGSDGSGGYYGTTPQQVPK